MSASSNTHKQQIHCGWLYKKGVLNNSWKRRYFILYSDKTMDYFITKNDTKPKGKINLSQIDQLTIPNSTSFPLLCDTTNTRLSSSKSQSFNNNHRLSLITSRSKSNKPYSFTLSTTNNNKNIQWVLSAENKYEYEQWILALTNEPKYK